MAYSMPTTGVVDSPGYTWGSPELIAEGGLVDLARLGLYSDRFSHGDRARLDLHFKMPISQDILSHLKDEMLQRGVKLWGDGIEQRPGGSWVVSLKWEQLNPGPAVIAAIVGVVLGGILVVAIFSRFGLFRYARQALQEVGAGVGDLVKQVVVGAGEGLEEGLKRTGKGLGEGLKDVGLGGWWLVLFAGAGAIFYLYAMRR